MKVNIVHPNAAVEVLKHTQMFIPCFDFLKDKMMIFSSPEPLAHGELL